MVKGVKMNFRILLGERGALSCLTKCERIYKIGGGSPEAAARWGEQRGTCAPPWD